MTDKMREEVGIVSGLQRKKSLQGHQYRRKIKPLSEQLDSKLSCVLGFIVRNNSAFTCDESSGNIAYPAGCVIVVHQIREKSQYHIFNPGHKNITCIQYSLDGQNIVTGESGHLPCVRVFSVSDRCQIASFQSHKFGISCVAFSPNSLYIISIGYQHDNVINVWNWKKNILSASNKVSIKVRAIAFAEDSSYFVTVGNRHVKFWYIESSKVSDTIPLKGRSGILGSARNQLFCDVACGIGYDNGYTFAITRTGMLCQFTRRRTLEKSIQIMTNAAHCICVVNGIIVCGCSASKVFLFTIEDLQLITSFSSAGSETSIHDLVAVQMDSKNMWLHCIHSDHSLRSWDLLDMHNPFEHSSSSSHAGCVWDVKVHSNEETDYSFISCSSDGAVYKWRIDQDSCTVMSKYEINQDHSSVNGAEEKNEKIGVRSLCIMKDGQRIAVGDRDGSVHIYSLCEENSQKEQVQQKLHDGDILSLDHDSSADLLVSASRDRCIYIQNRNFIPVYRINDHSAAVTAVKFVHLCDKIRLISCGVDKSLYFCTVTNQDGNIKVIRDQHIVEKHAMHDMSIIKDVVLVACGAGIHEYDIVNGKHQRHLRCSESTSTILRVIANSDGTQIAISCADKSVYVLSYQSGESLLEVNSHSEICTAFSFFSRKNDNYLLIATADSCIFLWKIKRGCETIEESANSQQNGTEENPSNGINMSGYFGDVTSSCLVVQENPALEEPSPVKCNGNEDDASDLAPDDLMKDIHLPSWITGNKEKIVQKQEPQGKWASRLQETNLDKYSSSLLLDTPIYPSEWEISQREDEDDDIACYKENENNDDANNERESKDKNESKIFAVTANGDRVEENHINQDTDVVPVIEKPKSRKDYQDEPGTKRDEEPEELNFNNNSSQSASSNADSLSKSPIPPAFANFLENLSKKKRIPATLPLRKSYEMEEQKIDVEKPDGKKEVEQEKEISDCNQGKAISLQNCEEVVNNLLAAYEQAENMYSQASGTEKTPCQVEVQDKLNEAFSSLKKRMNTIQGTAPTTLPSSIDMTNMAPFMTLIRSYSDKLLDMVRNNMKETL